jgi:tRNA1(Val) A37 N6-methylase TrmN6
MKSKNQLDEEMFYVAKLIPGNGRFLDIGSNIGIWAYFMRNRFAKIDTYEPISEITERFRSLNFDMDKNSQCSFIK